MLAASSTVCRRWISPPAATGIFPLYRNWPQSAGVFLPIRGGRAQSFGVDSAVNGVNIKKVQSISRRVAVFLSFCKSLPYKVLRLGS